MNRHSPDAARAMAAAVREMHFEYLPAHVEFYTCAHCNTLRQFPAVEPWPCPTIRAMDEAADRTG